MGSNQNGLRPPRTSPLHRRGSFFPVDGGIGGLEVAEEADGIFWVGGADGANKSRCPMEAFDSTCISSEPFDSARLRLAFVNADIKSGVAVDDDYLDAWVCLNTNGLRASERFGRAVAIRDDDRVIAVSDLKQFCVALVCCQDKFVYKFRNL